MMSMKNQQPVCEKGANYMIQNNLFPSEDVFLLIAYIQRAPPRHTGLPIGHFSGSPFLTGPLNPVTYTEEICLRQLFCNWFLLLHLFQQIDYFFQCLFFLFLPIRMLVCYQKCLSTQLHIKVLKVNLMFKVLGQKELFVLCIKPIKLFTEGFII